MQKRSEQSSETVRISLNYLTLDPKSSIWDEFKIDQIFAEYDFLGSVEEMPDAVPMPKSRDEKINLSYSNSELKTSCTVGEVVSAPCRGFQSLCPAFLPLFGSVRNFCDA